MNRTQLKALIKECINESLFDEEDVTEYTLPIKFKVRFTRYTEYEETFSEWLVLDENNKIIGTSTNSEADAVSEALSKMFTNIPLEKVENMLEKSNKVELNESAKNVINESIENKMKSILKKAMLF